MGVLAMSERGRPVIGHTRKIVLPEIRDRWDFLAAAERLILREADSSSWLPLDQSVDVYDEAGSCSAPTVAAAREAALQAGLAPTSVTLKMDEAATYPHSPGYRRVRVYLSKGELFGFPSDRDAFGSIEVQGGNLTQVAGLTAQLGSLVDQYAVKRPVPATMSPDTTAHHAAPTQAPSPVRARSVRWWRGEGLLGQVVAGVLVAVLLAVVTVVLTHIR